MATLQDLKDAVDRLLNLSAAAQTLQLNSDKRERAYEAYVLALCVDAVRRCSGTAELKSVRTGLNPPVIVFRGAPGSMASTSQDFCYVDCSLGSKRFEIHLDVVYEGQSGANHEIDVSIVQTSHAEAVRASCRMPRTNKNLLAVIECKFYDSVPGVALARTFVGLIRDCSNNRLNAFVSNRGSIGLSSYLSSTWAPQPYTDLSPLSVDAEMRFICNMEQMLRKWMNGR